MKREEKGDEFSPKEKAAFAALQRERMPPVALEEKTISALKARGLLHAESTATGRGWPKFAVAMSAAAACLLLGFVLGRWRPAPATPHAASSLFVLFLYGGDSESVHEESHVQEYSAWIQSIAQAGRLANGEKLKASGRVLRKIDGQLQLHDLPRANSAGMLGGYFIIAAENYEEALKIAADCPHLKYGGAIELREVDAI